MLEETERELHEQLRRLDWEAEYVNVARAIDDVFRRNGWDSESDRYALELTLDVARIPPWQFLDRFRLFLDRVSERYHLTDEQRERLQAGLLREIATATLAHGGMILRQAGEILETRLAAKPFTAEQVAQWVKESDALFEGARAAADRLKNELGVTLTSEQVATFQRDVTAFDRRLQVIADMRAHWRQGRWRPEQWGLADDPIHRQAALRVASGPPSPVGTGIRAAADAAPALAPKPLAVAPGLAVAPLPTKWVSHDPETWIAYLVEQRSRYALDAAQTDAAESIYLELVTRGRDYLARHEADLRTIPMPDRPTHSALDPVRVIFAEMQQRLDALPTTAQRTVAGP